MPDRAVASCQTDLSADGHLASMPMHLKPPPAISIAAAAPSPLPVPWTPPPPSDFFRRGEASVADRRDHPLSGLSQMLGISLTRSVGLQARTSTRNVALQVSTDVPPIISFPGPNPGRPSARGVPFEHRCPDSLRVYITPTGDAWHTIHTCANTPTRHDLILRPCRICAAGYAFPQLLYDSDPSNCC